MTIRTPRALFAVLSLGAALASLSGAARAGQPSSCPDGLFADVGKHLGVAAFTMNGQESGVIVAADCTQAPDKPELTLTVIAWDSSVDGQKKLFIGFVDEQRHQVVSGLSSIFEEDAMTEIGYDSLRLDIAPYTLAPGVRAFGFDLSGRNRHYCVDGGIEPFRYLYVQEGKTIRPVMEAFEVSSWRYIGEDKSRCRKIDAPKRPIEYTDRSLSIAPGRTNGYANLLVISSTRVDGKSTSKRKTRLLRYNGESYPLR